MMTIAKMYRFKTEEEFKRDGQWDNTWNVPIHWNTNKRMNNYIGSPITSETFIHRLLSKNSAKMHGWEFSINDITEIKMENLTSLIPKTMTKKTKNPETQLEKQSSILDNFVFMEKTLSILDIGFLTQRNVILYGPGGYGKSEMTMAFFQEKGIDPYVITMGTGMTTDRLFGGLDIPTFEKTGKIEYLIENSFMNHEFVVFEEMMDAPDFILEQLKDILSSGVYRNGTQVFPIKTKFIVCCTNRTRDEFSKNQSLKALMERFPLELNVVWDNHNEITYTKLLENKFGEENVEPIIPYILQEYAKASITISPRIAIVAHDVFLQCGPESLGFIAEFAKKPALITGAIKKFESSMKFRTLSTSCLELIQELDTFQILDSSDKDNYGKKLKELKDNLVELGKLTVSDDDAQKHADVITACKSSIQKFEKKQSISKIVEI